MKRLTKKHNKNLKNPHFQQSFTNKILPYNKNLKIKTTKFKNGLTLISELQSNLNNHDSNHDSNEVNMSILLNKSIRDESNSSSGYTNILKYIYDYLFIHDPHFLSPFINKSYINCNYNREYMVFKLIFLNKLHFQDTVSSIFHVLNGSFSYKAYSKALSFNVSLRKEREFKKKLFVPSKNLNYDSNDFLCQTCFGVNKENSLGMSYIGHKSILDLSSNHTLLQKEYENFVGYYKRLNSTKDNIIVSINGHRSHEFIEEILDKFNTIYDNSYDIDIQKLSLRRKSLFFGNVIEKVRLNINNYLEIVLSIDIPVSSYMKTTLLIIDDYITDVINRKFNKNNVFSYSKFYSDIGIFTVSFKYNDFIFSAENLSKVLRNIEEFVNVLYSPLDYNSFINSRNNIKRTIYNMVVMNNMNRTVWYSNMVSYYRIYVILYVKLVFK